MNAGSSVKPRKAQVKDKGLVAESGDFGGENGPCHRNFWQDGLHLAFKNKVTLNSTFSAKNLKVSR